MKDKKAAKKIIKLAKNNPKKIVTTKINLEDKISDKDCEKIVEIFNLKLYLMTQLEYYVHNF